MVMVKVSFVLDPNEPVTETKKAAVAVFDDKGVQQGDPTVLEVSPPGKTPPAPPDVLEMQTVVPPQGKLEVTQVMPPVVYDVEQKATVYGDWPPEAEPVGDGTAKLTKTEKAEKAEGKTVSRQTTTTVHPTGESSKK